MNYITMRHWENQMRYRREGRGWRELPSTKEPIPRLPVAVKIGPAISSLQATQPFLIWAICKFRDYYGPPNE